MLTEQLLANVGTDVKFFRRNRVFLGASLLYLVITGFSLIPALVFMSSSKQFDIIKALHDSLSTAVTVVVALMGLLFMSSHFHNRNVKMVLTKPCPPETWLAGALIAAAGISLLLHLIVSAITGILFVVWGLPFQAGLIFVTIDNFLSGLVILSFLVFLATAMPPVLAAIVALMANETAIYFLRTVLTAGSDASHNMPLAALNKALYVLYMVLPSYSFLNDRSGKVFSTWRVEATDWTNLSLSLGYTVAIVTLFYLLTLATLRRKSLG